MTDIHHTAALTDRQQTAIHEAGHAVAHVRLEIDYADAAIDRPRDGVEGEAVAAGAESVWDADAARAQVLANCSGYGALVGAGVAPEAASLGADDDFENATELIESWGLTGTLDEWKARAVALMSEPRNRKAVQVIASELLERKRLDYDLISIFVELSDGTATRADVDRFLDLREGRL